MKHNFFLIDHLMKQPLIKKHDNTLIVLNIIYLHIALIYLYYDVISDICTVATLYIAIVVPVGTVSIIVFAVFLTLACIVRTKKGEQMILPHAQTHKTQFYIHCTILYIINCY